jgi:hypothetical protein
MDTATRADADDVHEPTSPSLACTARLREKSLCICWPNVKYTRDVVYQGLAGLINRGIYQYITDLIQSLAADESPL